jgi:hypothetical protein
VAQGVGPQFKLQYCKKKKKKRKEKKKKVGEEGVDEGAGSALVRTESRPVILSSLSISFPLTALFCISRTILRG